MVDEKKSKPLFMSKRKPAADAASGMGKRHYETKENKSAREGKKMPLLKRVDSGHR